MSSLGRSWRSFVADHEIDTWPLTFAILCIHSTISLIGLIMYTYFNNPPPSNEWILTHPIYTSIYQTNNQYSRFSSLNGDWSTTQSIYQTIASQFVAGLSCELVLGLLICYYCMRPIEPMLGRNIWLRLISLISIIALCGLIDGLIVSFTNQSTLQSGMYWLFGLLPFYVVNQSVNQSIKLGPMKFNDKYYVYLLFTLFLFCKVVNSLINCSIGLLIGLIYLFVRWILAGGFDRMIEQSRLERRGFVVGSSNQSNNQMNVQSEILYEPAATEEPQFQPVNQSINQPINQSIKSPHQPRPTSHYEKLIANAKKGSRTNQSNNQSNTRTSPINQTDNQTTVNQSINQSNNQSNNQSVRSPNARKANEVRQEELIVSRQTH